MLINHSFLDRWSGPSFAVSGKRKIGQELIDVILPRMAGIMGLCEASWRAIARRREPGVGGPTPAPIAQTGC